ncbi:hypothetical protein EXIGLDRAFT_455645 [Exidia glandulosa HHB12029]|uniref:Uncharacterized protein n=1 Tax=Exidia glandulosa HHB12029 TaxID=1314781 RepID=A0A165PLT8_EXIGL|nr:hypothetical protein EXIGLDRAFT_455645 [Exidia glandulosa HHB12029]
MGLSPCAGFCTVLIHSCANYLPAPFLQPILITMHLSSLATFTAIALSIGVSAAPAKRDTLSLPTTASVWVQTDSGDTIAVLTENGQAWQWADENGDGPEAGQFDIKLVPGSMQPSGDDALVKLAHNGQECSLTNDAIDCTSTGSPAAVLRAKVKTDVVGETRWFLLGGHPQFSLEDWDQEKKLLAVTPDHGLGVNVYLTDAAAA